MAGYWQPFLIQVTCWEGSKSRRGTRKSRRGVASARKLAIRPVSGKSYSYSTPTLIRPRPASPYQTYTQLSVHAPHAVSDTAVLGST